MNNKQVAHLWANQSKQSAKGSNFYFEGNTIYSYGRHFPIAKIMNENLIFFTTRKYSNTTSKHKVYTFSSIDRTKYKILEVKHVIDHEKEVKEKNLENFAFEIRELKKKLTTTKKYKEQRRAKLHNKIQDYIFYCKLIKKTPKKSIMFVDMKVIQKEIEAERIAKKQQKEKYAKIEAEREKSKKEYLQKELNKFFNGDAEIKTVEFRYGTNFLKIVGEKCITNSGAEVSKNQVRVILNILKNESKLLIGSQIGDFTINSLDEKGIKIGCHFFDTQEINRIIQLFK